MASNIILVPGDGSEQTTSVGSSPLVSVHSCADDNKQEDKSDSEARHKTTPVIREPSQSSEKSTPVSPMDNAFFPGPEKWWYQKESEQTGPKKGPFLDLEPDNWWRCRRHSEADIVGIPPPSPDRRHSFSPDSTSSGKPTAQDCKMQEKTDEKKDELKTDGTNGCGEYDESDAHDGNIFVFSDKERPKYLNPPKSDIIDLSDVDEEQEPISDKDDTRICSEHPHDADQCCFDDLLDFQPAEMKDALCEKVEDEELIPGVDESEHHCDADQPCFSDQTDCPHFELTDNNVMSEGDTKLLMDQEQHQFVISNGSDDINDFDVGTESEHLEKEADSAELQSTFALGHSTEIKNSEILEESDSKKSIEKLDLETPEQVKQNPNSRENCVPLDINTEQIAENNQNKEILESIEDIPYEHQDKQIDEHLSPIYNDKTQSVETKILINSECCQKEFDCKEQGDLYVGNLINDSNTFDNRSIESSSDKDSDQQDCPQINISVNPEDKDIHEKDKPSPSSSNIMASSVVKQSSDSGEETPVLLSHVPVSKCHQTTGLSQRYGKRKLEKDQIFLSKEESTCSVVDDAKWNSFQIFISICVVLLLLGYLALSSLLSITMSLFLEGHDDMSHPSKPSREVILSQHLKHLEADFPSQDPYVWTVIENAVLNSVQDFPSLERPLIILLAGLSNTDYTTRCLATKLGVMFDDIFQSTQSHFVENGILYKEKSADYTKNEMDELLRSGFQSGSNCAIIHNVDAIPPCAMSLFHSVYEYTLYKDVSIMFTIQLQQNLEGLEEKYSREDYKELVHNYLQNIWEICSPMAKDVHNILLSRIAGNSVIIKEESSDHLGRICS